MADEDKVGADKVEKKKDIPFNELVEELEKRIQSGDGDALEITLQAIIDAGVGLKDVGLRQRGVRDTAITHHYTRLASVITHVITTYDGGLSAQRYEAICWRKQDVSYIFAVSGYRSMAHLVNLCSSRNEDGSLSLKRNRALLLLAFLDIDHLTSELLDFALTQDPVLLLPLMIGWLSQRAILTERGESNRTKILQSGHLIENVQIEDRHLPMISVAYMYVTYAVYPGRHEFKRSLNKLCGNLLERRKLQPVDILPPKRKKPRLLVIHEWFSHSHAMYRCYAPLVQALGRKFELHSLASPEGIDAEAAKLFKSSTVVEPLKVGIPGILKEINRLKPDAIFYPSVGMAYWVILLSNLRLAPVQFASQGHPATTMSPFIDFMFVWRRGFKSEHLYSERVVVGQSDSLFAPHAGLKKARPNPRYTVATSEVNIAINAKLMKLNHQIFGICAKITERSALPVTFQFFPGEKGWAHDGIVQSISNHVPNSIVHPLMKYEDLLEKISMCDFALSPMPFGNTNSVIDCSLLAVPNVGFLGEELSAQTDALVMELFDAPKELINSDLETYTECAIRLANDLEFRMRIRRSMDRDKIYKCIYDKDPDVSLRDDIEEIWRVYSEFAQGRLSEGGGDVRN
jgi:hypothetical protein